MFKIDVKFDKTRKNLLDNGKVFLDIRFAVWVGWAIFWTVFVEAAQILRLAQYGKSENNNNFSQVLSGIGDAILRIFPIVWLFRVLV